MLQLHLFSHLSVNPRIRPLGGASLCIYKALFARQAIAHLKTNFEIQALSNKYVQAFLRFRMGSHSLPCITGRAARIPKAQRV